MHGVHSAVELTDAVLVSQSGGLAASLLRSLWTVSIVEKEGRGVYDQRVPQPGVARLIPFTSSHRGRTQREGEGKGEGGRESGGEGSDGSAAGVGDGSARLQHGRARRSRDEEGERGRAR
jgi:hypothetical protein